MGQGGIAHALRKKRIRSAGTVLQLLRHLRRVYRRESDVDLVHVNWLQNALPLLGIPKPVLITVLGSDFVLLSRRWMRALLRRLLSQRRCILAPNAGWMGPTLEAVFGDVAEVRPISFGVDDRWFSIRRNLDPYSPPLWIVVSRLTKAKLGPLFDWADGLFSHDRPLHLFGPFLEEIPLPPWVNYHGPVEPARLQNEWFPRAFGLITLSQHTEGRPQVVLEAMAAGLPVIASDIPAHGDLIRDRETGWLARTPQDVREGVTFLGKRENNESMGNAARSWVRESIGTWDDCARRYVNAYQDLVRRAK
jgi:glycosyltransferase involved in cell wall biosynthesis